MINKGLVEWLIRSAPTSKAKRIGNREKWNKESLKHWASRDALSESKPVKDHSSRVLEAKRI